jgi:hypothetical protein
MWAEVNAARAEAGLPAALLGELIRAEQQAVGHSDYTSKYALYCAELAQETPVTETPAGVGRPQHHRDAGPHPGIAAAIAAGETVHPQALDLALDALEAAVRHHDAEVVRDFADQEDGLLVTPKAAVYVQGIRDGADRIAPKEGP